MDCAGCGACCVDQDIPLTLIEQLLTSEDEMEDGFLKKVNGRCIRLDPVTRRCKDYANRPRLCRRFRVGCGQCVIMRAFGRRHLNGVSGEPLPSSTKTGLYDDFTSPLSFETDERGRLSRIIHPNPDYHTWAALSSANEELPSTTRF